MPNHQKSRTLTALGKQLGVTFADSALLQQALTHTSYANERKTDGVVHNERLEFLGDAVLDLIVSEYLFRHFRELPEGELTKARAAIVCEPTLARIAKELGIGEYLMLGKGEAASGGRDRISILADAFEAIIGAIYLDCGFDAASRFVLCRLQDNLTMIEQGNYAKDFKTLLQEVAQRNGDCRITYEVIGESGPDHSKVFKVMVSVNAARLGVGSGKSKKEAEQSAAEQALQQFNMTSD
jgi:ribonuclease-3